MVLFTCFQFLFLFLLFSFPSQKICTNIFFFLSEISFTYNNINTCTPTTATPLMASSPALRAVQLLDLHGWLFPNPKILHGQRRVPPLNEPTELPIQHFGCVSLQPKKEKRKRKRGQNPIMQAANLAPAATPALRAEQRISNYQHLNQKKTLFM